MSTEARRRGRQTKLTADREKAICANLQLGIPLCYAAEAEGVADRTVREWVERGNAGEEPYARFAAALTRAKALAVKNLVIRSLSGGKGSSNAEFHLSRRFREHYGSTRDDDGGKQEMRIVVEGGLPARPVPSADSNAPDAP